LRNGLEEIGDWLDLQGDISFEEGKPSLESIIVETVTRLPDDIYDRLVRFPEGQHLWFVGCGPGQLGQAVRRYYFRPRGVEQFEEDLIVLSNELCSMSTEQACGVVAHEIAHVVLGHTSKEHTEKGLGIDERSEGNADALVISWGFEALA
jgi:hypothetical protein